MFQISAESLTTAGELGWPLGLKVVVSGVALGKASVVAGFVELVLVDRDTLPVVPDEIVKDARVYAGRSFLSRFSCGGQQCWFQCSLIGSRNWTQCRLL